MKIHAIIISVMFFCMVNRSLAQVPYVALSVHELNAIEERKPIDYFYQLDFNMATVTMFKDGTATLFPGSGLGEGLLFYDLRLMKKMIEGKSFPVKGDGSFWENEKDRVLHLNNNIGYYCSKVSMLLGFEVELTIDKMYLNKLSGKINQKFYKRKVKHEEYLFTALYIGELIRAKNKGRWVLYPEFTLNVYYIPEIVVGKNFCNAIWHVVHRLEEASYMSVDVEKIIEEANFVPQGKRTFVEINNQ